MDLNDVKAFIKNNNISIGDLFTNEEIKEDCTDNYSPTEIFDESRIIDSMWAYGYKVEEIC